MDKRLIRFITVIIVITGLALWTCQPEKDTAIYVAASKYKDTATYSYYKTWLQGIDSNIALVDLYHIPLDSALRMLENCSGLLLTGGADVHPGYYNQQEDTVLCQVDPYRDTLEMAVIARAMEMKLPVFGICRGLQVLNVFMGGSLCPDIPERFSQTIVHRAEDGSFDARHEVTLVDNTQIRTITGKQTHEVNSTHHQGIHQLAPGLKAAAFSPDTLIEAIERDHPAREPFLMAVQWHPERLGLKHPLSGPLARYFVDAIHHFHKQKRKR